MKRFQESFTLLELLVVITIIGILASIVVVSMSGSTDSATIAKGKVYAQQVHVLLGHEAVLDINFNENATGTCPDGKDVCDASGYNNNGTIYGASFVSSPVDGYALSFDGVDDYVVLTNNYIFTANNTLELWLNLTSLASYQAFLCKTTGSYSSYLQFGVEDNTQVETLVRGETDTNSDYIHFSHAAIPFLINNWYHIVITQDNDKNWFLYINGQYMDDDTTTDANFTFQYIGRAYPSGRFNGLIDEVRIYAAALPVTEIQKHYVQGLGKLLVSQTITQAEYEQKMEESNQLLPSI